MKKKIKRNGWELNTGLFEIYWKDDVAIIVKINGSIFHAAHRVRLKPLPSDSRPGDRSSDAAKEA